MPVSFKGKLIQYGLDRMIHAIENGEIDTVVVFAFSRFARSVSHMLKGLEVMRSHKTNFVSLTEKLDLNTSLGHVVFVIISAIAQLERDLIAERVRNGLAAAKARGQRIGRVRKRNSVLIESLLEAGLSFREVAKIAKCSHGSVSAQKKEWLARKAKEKVSAPKLLPEGVTAQLDAAQVVTSVDSGDVEKDVTGTGDGASEGQQTQENC